MTVQPAESGRFVRPGYSVDILLERDDLKNSIRVLKAMIYEVDGKRIVISQTSPPLTRSHIGKPVFVTYLVKREGKAARYGFSSSICEFIKDYEMASGERVIVPVLRQDGDPEPMNIRFHFRVRPKSDSGLSLAYGGNKVNLMDISLGGTGFNHGEAKILSAGDTIRLRLNIDERDFDVDARVIRAWFPEVPDRSRPLQFVSVRFLPMERDLEYALSRKIMMIERKLLAEGLLKA